MTRLIQCSQTVNVTSYKQFKFLIFYEKWKFSRVRSPTTCVPDIKLKVVKIDQSTFI